MTRYIIIHPDAVAEIRGAVRWYELRSSGIGRAVLVELRRTVERLRSFPEAYPEIKPGVRRASVARLPYQLVYSVTPDGITLIGLIHVRRDQPALNHRLE